MKMKEQLQKQQNEDSNRNLSFEEWLEYFSKEPTSKELEDMEKESKTVTNNPYYQPLQGA